MQAVLLDALGTLVDLEPPWVHLPAALELEPQAARAAFEAEMAFYKRA